MNLLKHPFTLMLCGPSSCGKTTFAIKLIKSLQPLENLLWFNGEINGLPKLINSMAKTVHISDNIPESFDDVQENSLIVLDDLMTDAYTKSICDLFTKGSHHKNVSVILITQNLFHQGKYCRDISLNCKYLVLFKNPRDKSQIYPLARQIYPENPSALVDVYKEATLIPHGYLFLDLTQSTNDLIRFQTDVFNSQYKTYFCPKNLLNKCDKNEAIEGKQTYATCFKKF